MKKVQIKLTLNQAVRLMQYFNIEVKISASRLKSLGFLEFKEKKEINKFLKEHREVNIALDKEIDAKFQEEFKNEDFNAFKVLEFSIDDTIHIQSILVTLLDYIKNGYVASDEEQTKCAFEIYELFMNPANMI